MGMSKNYKYFQKKVFEKIMGLKLEKNNVESSYLCKILNKINNYMDIPEGKITKELNMNYIDRMKGLIVSFYDKSQPEHLGNQVHKKLVVMLQIISLCTAVDLIKPDRHR